MRVLWLVLAACGPAPVEVATTAVAEAGVEGAALEASSEGAWTFAGTRHGLPCRGSVKVEGDAATVQTGVCPPVDADGAPLLVYRHLIEQGLQDLQLAGGPERYVIKATGCSGNATRHPGGALSGEARCGEQRHPFEALFPDRPRRSEEQDELRTHVASLAEARGLEQVTVAVDPTTASFRGMLGGQPCEGRVDLGEPVQKLVLDATTCPGAAPPPEALASREAWLAWMLAQEGFADVVVGPGESVAATLGDDRLQGTARFSGPRVTVALAGGDRTIVRLVSVPEALAE